MSDPEDPGGAEQFRVALDDRQSQPADLALLRNMAAHALGSLGAAAGAELSLVLVEPEEIAVLKETYLGERLPTDVLAFPMDGLENPGDGSHLVGDVVLCPAVAERQALEGGRSATDELNLLLVHGILHLAGHDHAEPAETEVMQAEEQRILQSYERAGA